MFKFFIFAAILAFAAAVPAPVPAPAPKPNAAELVAYNPYAYNPYNAYVGIGPLPYSYQPLITSYSGVAPSFYKPTAYIL